MRGTQRPPAPIELEAARDVGLESFFETGFVPYMRNSGWPEKLNDAGWPLERLFSAWKLQRDTASEHAILMASDRDVESLATALKSFVHLTSVTFTGGEGTGGLQKLLRNGAEDYIAHGDIYRVDGRQLTAFLLAAATALQTTNLASAAGITSFKVDKNFWTEIDDRQSESKTYRGSNPHEYPDFGTIPPETLISALPFLSAVRTLELSLLCKDNTNDRREIEARLTTILAALPVLEDLTLHNTDFQLLLLHQPLQAIVTTSVSALKLQHCVLQLADMQTFLLNQAATFSTIHLENIALLGGHFVELFTFIRNTALIKDCVIKGWLLEFAEERLLYSADVEYDDEAFEEDTERRNQAREGIAAFVRREREDFPTELLDEDSSVRTDYEGGRLGSMIEVIGEARFVE